MSHDIFTAKPTAADRSERATRAVKAFRGMQPGLTGYARAITGRKDVTVELAQGVPRTDGKKIYFKPPIGLGDLRSHERGLCDRRDRVTKQQLCEACRIREEVLITIYHEIAHIVYGTFEPVSEAAKIEAVERAIEETGGKYAERIRETFEKLPSYKKSDYLNLASTISPFLPILVNALEDARVDADMFRARKGTKTMFDAYVQQVFANGTESDEGDMIRWSDKPLNSQALIGVFVLACEYTYEGWFDPKVEEALADPRLNELVRRIDTVRSAYGTYQLAFPILARLRELGFCKLPEDPDDETPEEEPQDEQQPDPDPSEPEDDPQEEDESDPDEDGSSDGQEGDPEADDAGSDEGDDGSPEPPTDGTSGDGGEDREDDDAPDEASDADSSDDAGEDEGSPSDVPDPGAGESEPDAGGEDEADAGEGGAGESGDGSDSTDADDSGAEGDAGEAEDSDGTSNPGGDGDGDLSGAGVPGEGDGDEPSDDGSPADGRPDDDHGDSRGDGSEEESADDQGQPAGLTNEDGDDDLIDTGADKGEGGQQSRNENYGTHENVLEDVQVFGQHEAQVHEGDGDMAADEKAIDVAIVQGMYFEKPSANVTGVREHKFDQHVYENGRDMSTAWEYDEYEEEYQRRLLQRHGVESDVDVPESILGPALLEMRKTFSDNQRAKMERHLRSGKINQRVLGKRAWAGDDRLFQKKRIPGKKSYAVLIGIDISGSTMGLNIALAKRAAMAQAELCARAGIDFAVYAHTANGSWDSSWASRDLFLDVYEIKSFDAPWSDTAKEALAKIGADSENLDGHTIEYYRKMIERQSATDKIILYYSDGKMPAANHDEELEILQREIAYCKKRNITLMGVGIRTDSPRRHGLNTVQVDDDSDLPKVVRHLETALLHNR